MIEVSGTTHAITAHVMKTAYCRLYIRHMIGNSIASTGNRANPSVSVRLSLDISELTNGSF